MSADGLKALNGFNPVWMERPLKIRLMTNRMALTRMIVFKTRVGVTLFEKDRLEFMFRLGHI
jgi:hypothetical protein